MFLDLLPPDIALPTEAKDLGRVHYYANISSDRVLKVLNLAGDNSSVYMYSILNHLIEKQNISLNSSFAGFAARSATPVVIVDFMQAYSSVSAANYELTDCYESPLLRLLKDTDIISSTLEARPLIVAELARIAALPLSTDSCLTTYICHLFDDLLQYKVLHRDLSAFDIARAKNSRPFSLSCFLRAFEYVRLYNLTHYEAALRLLNLFPDTLSFDSDNRLLVQTLHAKLAEYRKRYDAELLDLPGFISMYLIFTLLRCPPVDLKLCFLELSERFGVSRVAFAAVVSRLQGFLDGVAVDLY